jgi:hypothetical protein
MLKAKSKLFFFFGLLSNSNLKAMNFTHGWKKSLILPLTFNIESWLGMKKELSFFFLLPLNFSQHQE